jgi:hypothetical protein
MDVGGILMLRVCIMVALWKVVSVVSVWMLLLSYAFRFVGIVWRRDELLAF